MSGNFFDTVKETSKNYSDFLIVRVAYFMLVMKHSICDVVYVTWSMWRGLCDMVHIIYGYMNDMDISYGPYIIWIPKIWQTKLLIS